MSLLKKHQLVGACAAVLVLGLGAAACGDDNDDGATVRESGPGASGGSASASGTASGSGSGSGSGTASGAYDCVRVGNSDKTPTGVIDVDLQEFTVAADPTTVAAGTIEFVATNNGEETHEIVIARFDGDPGDIPVDADGAADESQLPDDAVIGEIEGFAGGGKICAAAFDLTPGKYALFCNIVEAEEHEAHYGMGMFTTFTVT
jgi:hypothetical protein